MATYVNVDEMERVLDSMLERINTLSGHIDSYNTSAVASLGQSSFRPDVEANLQGVKSEYQKIVPELEKMKSKIDEIKAEYISSANKITGTGSAATRAATGSTTSTAPLRTVNVEQTK